MVPRAAAAALLFAVLTLAGCSQPPAKDTVDDDPTLELGLEATDTTGVLRGVVVDEAIRPVANVSIVATGSGATRMATSNADGAFGFDGLSPGVYIVKASKPGFFPAQTNADV